jgi:protein-arginine kinase activator protein McsA
MTNYIRTAVFVLISFTTFSQGSPNQNRIKQIPLEIQAALKAENYEKAAELKKEKELREEMQKALQTEDYAKAAELKNQIDNGGSSSEDNSSEISRLEKEMNEAVKQEDYKKAGDLKRQIETIQNGGTVSNTAATTSSITTSNNNVPSVDFVNQVYLLNSDGTLSDLEKAEGKLTTSGGGFVVASATSSYILPGTASPVKVNQSNARFVVKVYKGIDPSETFKFLKFDIRGRRSPSRYADQYKSTAAMYHSETGAVTDQYIEVQFKQLSDEVFEIIIPKLEPGEYSFVYINKFFAFGIN